MKSCLLVRLVEFAAIFVVAFTLSPAFCFAEQGIILKSRDLCQQASWLDDLRDYDVEWSISIVQPGMALDFSLSHKALAPDFASTSSFTVGKEQRFLCNGDSLWTILPSFSTYTVKAWESVSTGDWKAEPFILAEYPPRPFEVLKVLVAPELEYEYEFVGEEELELKGMLHQCEIWNIVDDPKDNLSDRIWIDHERRIILKTDGSSEMTAGKTLNFEFRIESLTTNAGLTHEDFQFIPPPGFKRVSTPSKMLVSDSLEGETPGDVELRHLAGTPINTAAWRGKVIVLDFWATWCGPCIKSLPHLRKLQAEFGEEILIVGVTGEPAATVEAFFKDDPSPYPIVLDEKEEARKEYRVSNYPTLFVLDPEGKVLDHFVGYQSEDVIRQAVEAALGN